MELIFLTSLLPKEGFVMKQEAMRCPSSDCLPKASPEIWQGSEHFFRLWKAIYAPTDVWPGHSSEVSDVSSLWTGSSSFTALYDTLELCSLYKLSNGGHWGESKLFLMAASSQDPGSTSKATRGSPTRQVRPIGKGGARVKSKDRAFRVSQFELPRASPFPSLESWFFLLQNGSSLMPCHSLSKSQAPL